MSALSSAYWLSDLHKFICTYFYCDSTYMITGLWLCVHALMCTWIWICAHNTCLQTQHMHSEELFAYYGHTDVHNISNAKQHPILTSPVKTSSSQEKDSSPQLSPSPFITAPRPASHCLLPSPCVQTLLPLFSPSSSCLAYLVETSSAF